MKSRAPGTDSKERSLIEGTPADSRALPARTVLFAAILGISAVNVAQAQVLEETIVTAQKRSTNLQDTPISMVAFSGDELERRGAVSIAQVADFTPNVQFDSSVALSGGSNASSIYIRGVGQSDFIATTEPGVGVYLDGVYIARSVGGVLDLMDIERVEVLRGPQGTLFGRNTIGGAISVITKKPGADFSLTGELTLGRFDRQDAKASINIPLVDDRLFASFGISTKNSDGYGDRVLTNDTMGGEDTDAYRLMLRFTPSDNFEVNFSLDHTKSKDDSPVTSLADQNARPGPPPPGGTWFGAYNGIYGLANGVPWDDRYFPADHEKSMATGPTGSDLEIDGTSLTIEWDLGAVSIRSITAYREWKGEFGRDQDHSPLTLFEIAYAFEQEQTSQEINIFGKAFDDRLDWLVGGYYFDESVIEDTSFKLVPDLFPPIPINGGGIDDIDNESFALFAQGTYQFTDQLAVTLGVRSSEDEKSIFAGARKDPSQVPGGPFLLANRKGKDKFNSTTSRFSIDYHPSEDLLVYGSYSEGFKSGGFVSRYLRNASAPIPFDPEEVSSFELGFKGDFLGNRLRLNGAVFYSEYDDIQITIVNLGVPETRNAAEGEITGIELEMTAVVSDQFRVNAGFGYMDAEYTKIDPGDLVGIRVDFDESASFVNTPERSLSVGIEYSLSVGDAGLNLRADYSYTSEVANDAVNTSTLIEDDLGLLSASATYTTADEHWEIKLYGRNLTDEDYLVSGNSSIGSIGYTEAVWGRPREYGVTARFRY